MIFQQNIPAHWTDNAQVKQRWVLGIISERSSSRCQAVSWLESPVMK